MSTPKPQTGNWKPDQKPMMCSKRLLGGSPLKGFLLVMQVECHVDYYSIGRTMKKYQKNKNKKKVH